MVRNRRHAMPMARIAIAVLWAGLCHGAWSQAFPSRPILWTVPFAPGGITDHTSRLLARHLTVDLGQQVIVDNRPGAGGLIGTEQVARATPDGHRVIYGTQGTIAASASLYKKLRYDPLRDFVPIHAMFASPNIIVTHPDRPYRNLADLVARAKASPGKLLMASAGPGTATHLAGEYMQAVTNIRLTHVPYKGSSPALVDLAGGQVDVMFDYSISSGPLLRAGKLRALGVTSRERMPMFPDVPTVIESGIDFETFSWAGMFAPAKTPPDVVARLVKAMAYALASDDAAKYAAQNGSRVLTGMNGPKFIAFIKEEVHRWATVVNRAGLQLD